MGDYVNGKRPEPGRHVERIIEKRTEVIKEVESDRDKKLDQDAINAIASAVIRAIGDKRDMVVHTPSSVSSDTFDSSESLSRLADAMVVQRSNNRSNFEDLGTVKTTKKDSQDVSQTIDILAGLDN